MIEADKGGANRVALFAMDGAFSRAVYSRLRRDVSERLTVLVPWLESPTGFPPVHVSGGESIVSRACRDGVPILTDYGSKDWLGALAGLAPDYILVACFPQRLDPVIRAVARIACLNLHPSMLPRYRGPTPVFWQLRNGEVHTGVTLHRVEERMDAGAIAGRWPLVFPGGASATILDDALGDAGARLFLELTGGGEPLRFVPQDEEQATCQSFPKLEDLRIATDWPVRHAWNFMKGVGSADTVFEVDDGAKRVRVRAPLAMAAGPAESWDAPGDGVVDLEFADGVIRATVIGCRQVSSSSSQRA